MKTILLLIAMILFVGMIGTVYADTVSQGAGWTDDGICNGVRLPLMECNANSVQYQWIYTWMSLGILGLIAASASQRNAKFWALILPVVASMFVWFGWMQLPTVGGVDPMAKEIGIIIMCGVLAFAVYMKGKQQESFGIAGPGTPILNIVFWMLIIQASISFVNTVGLFGDVGNASPLTITGVDLKTTVPNLDETGGLLSGLTADLMASGALIISSLLMIFKIIAGIANFGGLVQSIAPFMRGNAIIDAVLLVFTVALDFMYAILIWTWFFKPPIGENV